jgi:4-hydroxybenzoate polyprenyltransferase
MPGSAGLWTTLRRFASLVRLSHTVFGLPFALASAAIADQAAEAMGQEGLSWARFGWIVLAFTAARTAAMGFNRIADREIDGRNPRTAGRELPRGAISLPSAWTLTLLSTLVFAGAAWALGPLPLALAPACVLVIFGYSLFKRISWSAHLVLGIALSLAPGGAWVAVTGTLEGWQVPTLLMVAVATWVAGFDILYSLQDESHDRSEGLHSVPVRFGVRGALVLSGLLHVATVGGLVAMHVWGGLGVLHAVGIGLIAAILGYEHWIVRPGDLSRINRAFFDLNGYVSIGYLACTLADLHLLQL